MLMRQSVFASSETNLLRSAGVRMLYNCRRLELYNVQRRRFSDNSQEKCDFPSYGWAWGFVDEKLHINHSNHLLLSNWAIEKKSFMNEWNKNVKLFSKLMKETIFWRITCTFLPTPFQSILSFNLRTSTRHKCRISHSRVVRTRNSFGWTLSICCILSTY